jgi:[protein-PII] uridylyltransferase
VQPLAEAFFEGIEASPGTPPGRLNEAVRAFLDAGRKHLLDLHDLGESARTVNEEHADLMDRLIRRLFRLSEDRFFADNSRLLGYRLAVVAVGGYGRRELCLASDVDLLFLYRGKINPYVETLTESIMQRLWDARLVVGGATRTIRDCLRVGAHDLSTLTSCLDARFLIGDPALFSELERQVRNYIRRDPTAFIEAKLEEERLRHERFGESLYLLQPNVREGVGGLRDYHTARWIARAVQWHVRAPEHLRLHGFVDDRELSDLSDALEFLWRVRNELHRSGRKDDRLHFAAQERLAELFGFESTEQTLGVEELMRSYYTHARAIERVSQRVRDHALDMDRRRRGAPPGAARSVEEGFAIVDDRLEIPRGDMLLERPARLFSALAIAQRHDVDLSARAQRLLRQYASLIDERFCEDPESARLFREIVCAPRRVYRTLSLMTELGLLGRYIPEFGLLIGLWQQDMYHTYTVDVHSLFLVEQLRRLRRGRYDEVLPLASELIREVGRPLVLYLSCLLHDIGKGRGGAHSAKGAALVPPICKRLGLNDEETEDVKFLVLHHLTLSSMAERRDVHDFRLILNVANLVETRSRLRSLYLLTVADIRSVSKEAWTVWKGGLLEALYRNAAEWLEAGVGDESAPRFFLQRAAEQAERTQSEATAILANAGVPQARVDGFLASMPRRYLLHHGPAEVAQHVRAALAYLETSEVASVAIFRSESAAEPFQGLVVLAPDRPGLFATVAGVLRASAHDVLGAQVYTTRERLAVEIFEVAPFTGGEVEEEVDRERLEARLVSVLEGRRDISDLTVPRGKERPAGVRASPSSVRVSNDESDFYSIVDVATTDRPGLLYDITRTLAGLELDIVMSRASTRASRVNDAFYVTVNGFKVTDPERLREIEQAVLDAVEQGGG